MSTSENEFQETLAKFQQMDPVSQRKLIGNTLPDLSAKDQRALLGAVLPKGDIYRTRLLVLLMVGLFVIALVALVGAIFTKEANAAHPLYLIATGVVSGTLGLFARSPLSPSLPELGK